MSSAAPALTKHQLETLLIEKCWKDPEFRKQVIANPKPLFEKFLGQNLPANLKIVVHEDDRNTVHLVVPPAPQAAAELSDEELEKVAGGTEIVVVTALFAGGAAIAIGTATVISTAITTTNHGW